MSATNPKVVAPKSVVRGPSRGRCIRDVARERLYELFVWLLGEEFGDLRPIFHGVVLSRQQDITIIGLQLSHGTLNTMHDAQRLAVRAPLSPDALRIQNGL